jgi:chemotaxis protein CheD
MGTIYVGVGEYAVSKKPEDMIKTMALGSCVGVILLDQINRAAGLLHIALPDSSISPKRVDERPGMFPDTGIPVLLRELSKLGYNGNGNLVVKLAGGAAIMDPNNTFNIGKRNLLAVKKILWKYKLGALAEDIEGTISRTVTIELGTGLVKISSPGRGEWEL